MVALKPFRLKPYFHLHFSLESFSHLVRMWGSMGTLLLHFTEEDFEAEMELGEPPFQDNLLVKAFFNPGLW